MSCDSLPSKAQFIAKQAAAGPMLVYCQDDLAKALRAIGCDFLLVTEETSPQELLNLDKILESG